GAPVSGCRRRRRAAQRLGCERIRVASAHGLLELLFGGLRRLARLAILALPHEDAGQREIGASGVARIVTRPRLILEHGQRAADVRLGGWQIPWRELDRGAMRQKNGQVLSTALAALLSLRVDLNRLVDQAQSARKVTPLTREEGAFGSE